MLALSACTEPGWSVRGVEVVMVDYEKVGLLML